MSNMNKPSKKLIITTIIIVTFTIALYVVGAIAEKWEKDHGITHETYGYGYETAADTEQ